MQLRWKQALNNLILWTSTTDNSIRTGIPVLCVASDVDSVRNMISAVARGIKDEYPFYADELPGIGSILFNVNNIYGQGSLNTAAFGELYLVLKHIKEEPVNMRMWLDIHPRVSKHSQKLYSDGHYSSAAEKAVKEVETRLRELFVAIKPNAKEPEKIGDIIGALLSENGAFQFCDATSTSGKNYRRGVQQIFEGTIAAYRNPAAHANLVITKREAIEQITLASQLMYILDKPSA